jgi:hypothetical protein
MAKIKLPEQIFGRKVDGAMQRVLEKKNEGGKPNTPPASNASDREGFIYVPSINVYFAIFRFFIV